MNSIISLFRSAVIIMTPLLFAAAGGLFPALAGTLNIALEGLLLAGAFSALAAFYYTGNFTVSLAAAAGAGLMLSGLHAFTAFKLRANVFITGVAVNLFSGGLCTLLSGKMFNTRGVITAQGTFNVLLSAPLSVPLRLPYWYTCSALFLLILAWLVIYKTPFGFRLRACEKHGEALISLGIKPDFFRVTALLISGLCAGVGGSFLSLSLGAFVPGMSAGKGWVALVAIFLGGRKPQGILAAAFIFGFADAFSNYAQGLWNLPADFIFAIPYLFTLLVLIAVSARKKPL